MAQQKHGWGGKLPGGGLAWGGVALFCAGVALLGLVLANSLVFYVAPSAVAAGTARAGVVGVGTVRLGGLVVADSLQISEQGVVFAVADLPERAGYGEDYDTKNAGQATLEVRYAGILPPLFAEGEEVIVEGRLASDGVFRADSVFSRHDEEYRPVSRETPRKALYKNP